MTTATRRRDARLSDEDTAKVIALIEDSDSVELKLADPRNGAQLDDRSAEDRPARCPDPPGFLLRHPGAEPVRARRRRSRSPRAAEGRRLPSSSSGRSSPLSSQVVFADCRSSASRWTRCQEASSAPAP